MQRVHIHTFINKIYISFSLDCRVQNIVQLDSWNCCIKLAMVVGSGSSVRLGGLSSPLLFSLVNRVGSIAPIFITTRARGQFVQDYL